MVERPRRGEIWWAELESAGRRPFLVLTRGRAIEGGLQRVLAVPATTRIRGLVTEVPLDTDDGMPRPSVLSVDSLRVIPLWALVTRIGVLGPERMALVCDALRLAVDC